MERDKSPKTYIITINLILDIHKVLLGFSVIINKCNFEMFSNYFKRCFDWLNIENYQKGEMM